MALKSCPECSHNVSSAASVCPSCGFPLKEDPVLAYAQRRLDFGKKVIVGPFIVSIVFALLTFVDRGFVYLAFGTGAATLLLLLRLAVAQAQLDKSKLKH